MPGSGSTLQLQHPFHHQISAAGKQPVQFWKVLQLIGLVFVVAGVGYLQWYKSINSSISEVGKEPVKSWKAPWLIGLVLLLLGLGPCNGIKLFIILVHTCTSEAGIQSVKSWKTNTAWEWNPAKIYHILLKYWDRKIWTNSIDPDQTPKYSVQSGSTLFATHLAVFRHDNRHKLIVLLGQVW